MRFDVILDSESSVSVAGLNITVPVDSFTRAPVAGDYVCETNKTPIPNIPETFHPVLAQAAAVRVLESMGDTKGAQVAMGTLARMIKVIRRRASSRVKAAPKKIISKNHTLNQMRRSY